MKEPYVEGVANHNGHESCVCGRETAREALDSGMCRVGIEPRKLVKLECRRRVVIRKAISMTSLCEMLKNSTWSETLYMYRNSLHGNREILQSAWLVVRFRLALKIRNGAQQ
jgi:hypothetical protein